MLKVQYNLACWLVAPIVLSATSCVKDEPMVSASPQAVPASLAFNISTNNIATRMSESSTQGNGSIKNLWLFPFKSSTSGESLEGNVIEYDDDMIAVGNTHNFCDEKPLDVPIGTDRFLCYALHEPTTTEPTTTEPTKFINGFLKPSIKDPTNKVNTSNVSFTPETIYPNKESEDNPKPKVDDKAKNIAEYLTDIANAIPQDNKDFFLIFVNEGHPLACSSANTEKLEQWAQQWAQDNGVTLPTTSKDISGYPENINLPDGAAVVMWQKPEGESEYRFVPQLQTTVEANINSFDRFVYPAELYYYANSTIKTSDNSQKDNYDKTWDEVLKLYEYPNLGTTTGGAEYNGEASVAIVDPLNYAVGCLQIGLVTSQTLNDAADAPKSITLSAGTTEPAKEGTFPLTAVFVSGQYEQAYDFTPKEGTYEQIIYDKEITGFSMGDAPHTGEPTSFTNTLVLQSKDGNSVRIALEFENNSGEDFEGANGTVFQGTKFYMVGTIEVTTGHTGDEEYKNRVFTKDHITRGTVTISSLKQAYTYLPDLLDPRLEIGIKLVTDWIQVSTTNVPL